MKENKEEFFGKLQDTKSTRKYTTCIIHELLTLKYEIVGINGTTLDFISKMAKYGLTRWHKVFVPETWQKEIEFAKILKYREDHLGFRGISY